MENDEENGLTWTRWKSHWKRLITYTEKKENNLRSASKKEMIITNIKSTELHQSKNTVGNVYMEGK